MTDRLPTFIVIGAPKCGTTSLFHYLRAHPGIYMPPRKEVNFFIKPDCLDRVDEYKYEFADAGGATVVGEASPRYTMYPQFPDVARPMAQVLPDVRLVYLVRNPVDRMLSQWHHDLVLYGELPSAEKTLMEYPQFFETSRYACQLDQYFAHYPREQILVLTAEALRDARVDTLRRVLRFIGASEDTVPPAISAEHNRTLDMRVRRSFLRPLISAGIYKQVAMRLPASVRRVGGPLIRRPARPEQREISEELRRSLEQRLAPEVQRLRAYMDDDFDGWGIA